jgi:hypothetical protein
MPISDERDGFSRGRWRGHASVALGAWLAASPATLGYHDAWMFWNDVLIGAAIASIGAVDLWRRVEALRWILCAAGVWLLYAPLWLWTRDPGAYAVDTLIGTLAIVMAVVPSEATLRADGRAAGASGHAIPTGWSYNPSEWSERRPIVIGAFVAFLIGRYLAAFQLGHIGPPWDPVFGEGSRQVLDSDVAKAWPVSDAGLGAIAFLLVAVCGCAGGRRRWRTSPAIVLVFVALIVAVAAVSLVSVAAQRLVVGAWCTLCLATAAIAVAIAVPAVDELVASWSFVRRGR